MSQTAALYLPARAKLNLVLRIVGRRADGYHLLESLFHTIALHDDVSIERVAKGRSIKVTADDERLMVPADDGNLAMRALVALQEEVADGGGFQIRLHKRIPNGGGLGGGSSDAACTLRLANRLLGDPLTPGELARIATRLGADVSFFLRGGTQWGRGVGDELSEAPAIARHFVLLVPPYACGTAAVYEMYGAQWRDGHCAATVPLTVPNNRDAAMGIGYCNQLESAAERVRPELAGLRRAVVAAGYLDVRMSGSGSTLFVAADTAAAAQRCQRELQNVLCETEHREVRFVVTASGPAIDVDHPSPQIPAVVRPNPLDSSS